MTFFDISTGSCSGLPLLRPRQRLRSASTAALVVPATRCSTLGNRPGFSYHSRQVVELTARRHHNCNISVTLRHKLKTFLFRRSYDTWQSAFCFIVLFSSFYFLGFLVLGIICNMFLQCFLHLQLHHDNLFAMIWYDMKWYLRSYKTSYSFLLTPGSQTRGHMQTYHLWPTVTYLKC